MLLAVLAFNAFSAGDERARRIETKGESEISLTLKQAEALARAVHPLVHGAPMPSGESATHDLGHGFFKPEFGGSRKPEMLRHGAVQGRAPPSLA